MDKYSLKKKIFIENIKHETKITGSIIDVNYAAGEGLFWIQYPTKLKKILNKGRHRPNVFYFKNLVNKSYRPSIGEYINCNYMISHIGELVFVNIDIDMFNTKKFLGPSYKANFVKPVKSRKKHNKHKRRNSKFKYKSGAPSVVRSSKKKKVSNSNSGVSKIKIKNSVSKEKPKKTTKSPRVFIIIGHSSECEYDKDEKELSNIKTINMLQNDYDRTKDYHSFVKKENKLWHSEQHQKFLKLKKSLETLQKGEKVPCDLHPSVHAEVFCVKCFKGGDKNYFFCQKCKTKILYNSKDFHILKYRINVKQDFKDHVPSNKIRFLNGQSSGRSGFTDTSFNIMAYMQKWPEFREAIYDAKDMKDMKKLDRMLNNLNVSYRYHVDNLDTNLSIYPRKNRSGRIITGPKDTLISFLPSELPQNKKRNEFLNGGSWPLGVYELPVFDINEKETYIDKYNTINNLSSYKFDKLFINNKRMEDKNFTVDSFEPEWKFYSILKSTDPNKIFKRSMLIDLPDLSRKKKLTKQEKMLESWKPEINKKTMVNRIIALTMEELYSRDLNVNKKFLLSNIIKYTLAYSDIKEDDEVIFITNICRLIHFEDSEKYYSINQTMGTKAQPMPPNKISSYVRKLRQESRN